MLNCILYPITGVKRRMFIILFELLSRQLAEYFGFLTLNIQQIDNAGQFIGIAEMDFQPPPLGANLADRNF